MNSDADTSTGHVLPYRLDVYATSVTDVVESVGGLLVDRSMAGWAVKVFIPEVDDARPLRILGASAENLVFAAHLASLPIGGRVVAASAQLAAYDVEVWEQLCALCAAGQLDLTVWGEPVTGVFPEQLQTVEHRLSVTARAFKSYALRAVGRSMSADAEVLHSNSTHRTAAGLGSVRQTRRNF